MFSSPEVVADLVFLGPTALLTTRPSGPSRSIDGGKSFSKVTPSPDVGCLAVHGSQLLGCGVDLVDGFALGRSDDQAAAWTKLLRHRELRGVAACAPGAVATWLSNPSSADPLQASRETRASCDPLWPVLVDQLGIEPQPEDDAGVGDAAPSDAAADAGAGHDDDGCGCRAGARAGSPSLPLALLAALAAAWAVRFHRD